MVAEGIHSENGFMGLEPKGQAHRKFTNKFSGGKIFFRAGLTGQTCHVGRRAFVPEIQIVSNRFFEKRPAPAVARTTSVIHAAAVAASEARPASVIHVAAVAASEAHPASVIHVAASEARPATVIHVAAVAAFAHGLHFPPCGQTHRKFSQINFLVGKYIFWVGLTRRLSHIKIKGVKHLIKLRSTFRAWTRHTNLTSDTPDLSGGILTQKGL